MEKWFLMRKGADFQKISDIFHILPRTAGLIRNKDVQGEDAIRMYLHGTISDLHDGMLMKDMDKAVDILCEKIEAGERIRIIGDYDIDGVNATYILLKGIFSLGGVVDVDIPDRMKDGYGLNKNLVDRAFDEGIDTIVTCDNGIAAAGEIQYGKELGMTIIVTDHHEVPYEEEEEGRRYVLPAADAVVDPKRKDCEYPFDGLCGAGVAYKLVEALYHAKGRDPEDVDYLMEHVAIATIGDLMDLVDENRIFVKQGLEMLKRTTNLGLKALMEVTGVKKEILSAYHIGYILGPCMNASGRLDTAKRTLELLTAENKKEAEVLAGDLKALNDNRKDMTAHATIQAIERVETTNIKEDKVLVIYLPDCHESLAGIVAGRVREKYYKPVFVLTEAEDGVKGSGRSIEAYHMFEALNECKELLTRFGGHKLAAGLSLPMESVEHFRKAVNEKTTLTEEDLIEKVSIDMQMSFGVADETFLKELTLLEPFGKGNTKPLFVEKDIEVLEKRILGKNQNVLKLKLKDKAGTLVEGIYFGDIKGMVDRIEEKKGKNLSFTYYPEINEYNGIRNIQMQIRHFQ